MNTLSNKLLKLIELASNADKVLDVSNMNNSVIGYKTIPIPSSKNNRKGVSGIAVVSNNYTTFHMTMNILGPQYMHFADEYNKLYVKSTIEAPPLVSDMWLNVMKHLDINSLGALCCVSKDVAMVKESSQFTQIIKHHLNVTITCTTIQQRNIWKLMLTKSFTNNIYLNDPSKGFLYLNSNGKLVADYYKPDIFIETPFLQYISNMADVTFRQISSVYSYFENNTRILLLSHKGNIYIFNDDATFDEQNSIDYFVRCFRFKQKIIQFVTWYDIDSVEAPIVRDAIAICFLTKDGKVHIGENKPRTIRNLKNIIKICVTYDLIITLDNMGNVYTFFTTGTPSVKQLDGFKFIKNIYSIGNGFFVIDDDGHAYFITGKYRNFIIHKIKHINPIIQCACAGNVTNRQLLLDNTGTAYFFNMTDFDSFFIERIDIKNVVQICKNNTKTTSASLLINNESVFMINNQTLEREVHPHTIFS